MQPQATRALEAVLVHGAENAFVLIDERPPHFERYGTLAKALCAPGSELGAADGLLVVRDMPGYDAEMQIYNADGSQAEMCGNGVRCVTRYLSERAPGSQFRIATLAGPIEATVLSRTPFRARVDIGLVSFPGNALPEQIAIEGETWTFYDVAVGNPHAVIFVEDVTAVPLARLGAAFSVHARFPFGTNVHVVEVRDAGSLRVRHFERGVGITRACGTGAVACAALAIAVRGLTSPVAVHVPGGVLDVEWSAGETARLSGPAEMTGARTIAV